MALVRASALLNQMRTGVSPVPIGHWALGTLTWRRDWGTGHVSISRVQSSIGRAELHRYVETRHVASLQAPSLEQGCPSLELKAPSLEVGAPSVELKAPSLELKTPSLEVGAPSVELQAPPVGTNADSEGTRDSALCRVSTRRARQLHPTTYKKT